MPRFFSCNLACIWSAWDSWSECSASCGSGIRTRTRSKIRTEVFSKLCTGDSSENEACTSPPPVDCQWSDWEEWTTCTVTCGLTFQRRLRVKRVPEMNCGFCDNFDAFELQNFELPINRPIDECQIPIDPDCDNQGSG